MKNIECRLLVLLRVKFFQTVLGRVPWNGRDGTFLGHGW